MSVVLPKHKWGTDEDKTVHRAPAMRTHVRCACSMGPLSESYVATMGVLVHGLTTLFGLSVNWLPTSRRLSKHRLSM